MKRIILLLICFTAIQLNSVTAQLTDDEEVVFNAILGGAFNLVVQDGDVQTATFGAADEYNLGISETMGNPGIDPGFTTVAMEATGNWYLKISAPDFTPIVGTGVIPINNLGVWCEATGVHQFGTEVACAYQSADAALGLSNTDITLIDLLTDNSGDQTDNLFVLHWLFGTMQGTMNPASMFSQLSDGIFSQGTYTSTVVLTMTEIP
ncbi:MAG TPA: hypothetical protein PKM34_08560 [Bacteroidales bacterium]|nr:hypothetical protein [Bacteroidales bacterium]HNQ83680.1 hypothetical protein [Bacteroidales bacterium]HPI87181.1 hypothetical protein [Bacteroidales bacterium]HPM93543.1 hypothetical protein [Bacteroidales bacterium]